MIWLAFLLQISNISGEKIFAQNCSVGYCHGAGGAAARGPRLRGRTFEKNYLYSAIRDGIPKSAMPAWKDLLTEEQRWSVLNYARATFGNPGDTSPPATGVLAPSPGPKL